MEEETNSNAENEPRGSVVNAKDAVELVVDAGTQTHDAVHVDVENGQDGPPKEDEVIQPTTTDTPVEALAEAPTEAAPVQISGLAALIPMAKTTPSLTKGVVSPRLVHFFCGLVYGEVRDVEFREPMLFQLIKSAMEMVESHASLSGREKKELVIEVVRQIVLRKHMEEALRERCLSLLAHWGCGEFIDLIVSASKGHFELNMTVAARKSCKPCVVS